HVEELLRRQIPQPGQDDLRQFEWYYYDGMIRHGEVQLKLPAIRALAWSPDSKTLAIGCMDFAGASVYLWDAVHRTPPVLLARNSKLFFVNALAFDQAGTSLAVGLGNFRGASESLSEPPVPGVIEIWPVPTKAADLKAPLTNPKTLAGHRFPVM